MELVLLTRIHRTRTRSSHSEFSGEYCTVCTVHKPGKPHHRSTNTIHSYPLSTPQIGPTLQNLSNFSAMFERGFLVRCCGCWVVVTKCRHGAVHWCRYWHHRPEQAPMVHHMGRVLGRPVVIILLYGEALELVFVIAICFWGWLSVGAVIIVRGVGADPSRVPLAHLVYFVGGLNKLVWLYTFIEIMVFSPAFHLSSDTILHLLRTSFPEKNASHPVWRREGMCGDVWPRLVSRWHLSFS